MSKIFILITGANSGIGLELARQLLASTSPLFHVLLTARNIQSGTAALQDLSKKASSPPPGTAEFLHLDVTSESSIAECVAHVQNKHGKLDVLVNNAGIASFPDDIGLVERMRRSFDTNAIGALLVGQAFLPLLKNAVENRAETSMSIVNPTPRMIHISSGAGSLTRTLAHDSPMYSVREPAYRASKAAMNMVAAVLDKDAEEVGVKSFVYCPGFLATNLSERNKEEFGARKVEDGVANLVDVVLGKRDEEERGEDGGLRFLHKDGAYTW